MVCVWHQHDARHALSMAAPSCVVFASIFAMSAGATWQRCAHCDVKVPSQWPFGCMDSQPWLLQHGSESIGMVTASLSELTALVCSAVSALMILCLIYCLWTAEMAVTHELCSMPFFCCCLNCQDKLQQSIKAPSVMEKTSMQRKYLLSLFLLSIIILYHFTNFAHVHPLSLPWFPNIIFLMTAC